MANNSSSKKWIVLSAGCASFAAAYWFNASDSHTDIVEPRSKEKAARVARAPGSAATVAGTAATIQMPARNSSMSKSGADIFSSRSWLPLAPPLPPPPAPPPPQPPAPPIVPLEAPKPVAPPLPFGFIGTLDEKGKARQVFLSKGDQLIVVKTSDVVDATYRIDQITDTSVLITYLPLNQQQTLAIQQGGS
jgi:hypothetical protein